MAAEVKLDVIIEALEMSDDSISSYLDVETGEVHSITEEEFDLAEDPQTSIEDLPNWQCEAVRASDTWLFLASSRSTRGPSWTASP